VPSQSGSKERSDPFFLKEANMTEPTNKTGISPAAAWRSLLSLSTIFLAIEFIDEFVFGVDGAALPSKRLDLVLTYAQVGMLLGLPHLINAFIEPFLMLLGDTHLRKGLIVGGGLVLTCALALTAVAPSFSWLLVAVILIFPASGAFVTLAQASLMDLHPGRESQMMARWVVSGSLANLVGPLFLGALFALALSWRHAYVVLAALALGLTLWTQQSWIVVKGAPPLEPFGAPETGWWPAARRQIAGLLRGLREALTHRSLMRWIVLLQLSDLMLDVLTGFMALYFSDVVGVPENRIPFLVGLFTGAGLVSDLLVIYLLERFPGRRVLRFSAAVILVLFPCLLLAPGVGPKIVLAVAVKLLTLGWYTILKGEAYAAMPERKGTVLALDSTAGFFGGLLPWAIGVAAGRVGLAGALWLLLLGPLGLLLWVPGSPRR
jgi:MFS transporter, FSR family, fosmidomycin resistance protein